MRTEDDPFPKRIKVMSDDDDLKVKSSVVSDKLSFGVPNKFHPLYVLSVWQKAFTTAQLITVAIIFPSSVPVLILVISLYVMYKKEMSESLLFTKPLVYIAYMHKK